MNLHGLAIEVYGAWGDDFTKMFNHFISLGSGVTDIPRAILAKLLASAHIGVFTAWGCQCNQHEDKQIDRSYP